MSLQSYLKYKAYYLDAERYSAYKLTSMIHKHFQPPPPALIPLEIKIAK